MQHLKAAGSRHSVVMSQNKMPFFGKSGTPRIELATSFFFSSSNIVPDVCCPDTTTVCLGLLTVGQRARGNCVISGGFMQVQIKPDQLLANMQPNYGPASSDSVQSGFYFCSETQGIFHVSLVTS